MNSELQQLQEKITRVQRDFSILYEISNAMRTTLELNHILYIILTGVTAHSGLGFNRALIFLANEDQSYLEPKMAIGPKSGEHAQKIWEHIMQSNQHFDDLIRKDKLAQNTDQSFLFQTVKNLKIPLVNHDNILAQAFKEGTVRHLTKETIQQRKDDIFLKTFSTHELVITPLKARNKVIGLIIADNIYTPKQVNDDDLKIFSTLANQAALAIENSRLYEMVRLKSHIDALTNLWNHGFFQEQLSKSIEESYTNKQALSLLMIDIDNFKTLNDIFGHQVGDVTVKEIANIIKNSSKETDFVCRYGGEEFSVILPQTNKQQAQIIAEKMRQKIEKNFFGKELIEKNFKITVSIGVASLENKPPSTKEALIATADKAMYKAKNAGKNRTCTV